MSHGDLLKPFPDFIKYWASMIYQIFIINFESEILVSIPEGPYLPKESILFEANSIEEGLLRIQAFHGQIKEKLKLYEVFSTFHSTEDGIIEVKGFILKLSFDSIFTKKLLKNKSNKFISYYDFIDFISKFRVKDDVKEAVYSLVNELMTPTYSDLLESRKS